MRFGRTGEQGSVATESGHSEIEYRIPERVPRGTLTTLLRDSWERNDHADQRGRGKRAQVACPGPTWLRVPWHEARSAVP